MEIINSRRNPLCVHIKKLGASRSYREKNGEFLCDGVKLLEEAVKCGADVTVVLTSSNVPFPLHLDTRMCYTDRAVIDSLSPMKNAQDTLFVCRIPKKSYASEIGASGAHILLDGVQDPGNVGAVIRTADAFGIKSVILMSECADPYNPKTVRATMGAIFRQDIYQISVQELAMLKEKTSCNGRSDASCGEGLRIVGAAAVEGARDIRGVSLKDSILAIGNEGRGLSDEILSLCDDIIGIPISPECESLNAAVAAAIIMWEARRDM